MAYVKDYRNNEEEKRREKTFSKGKSFLILVIIIVAVVVLVLPHNVYVYKPQGSTLCYVVAVNPITQISYYLKLDAEVEIEDENLYGWYNTKEKKVFVATTITEYGVEYYYVDEYILIQKDSEQSKEFSPFEIFFQSIFTQSQFKKTKLA